MVGGGLLCLAIPLRTLKSVLSLATKTLYHRLPYPHSLHMRLVSYTLCLAGVLGGALHLPGSTLETTDVLSVTAGPYPKLPDVVECSPEYGEGLSTQSCYNALQQMPDGRQFSQFVSRKSYPGQSALITPVYYYDNTSKSWSRRYLDRGVILLMSLSSLNYKTLSRFERH